MLRSSVAALGAACLLVTHAHAHVIAGARVFPVTLTFDDPGVADEASLPAFSYQRTGSNGGTGPGHDFDFGFEYDKTITENTAIIFNDGYNFNQTNGSKTQTGWQNLVITGKWQAYTNAPHEFVLSLGIIRELGGTATLHTGGDKYGSTTPTIYAGKGLGDLDIGLLRPVAFTGEFGYTVADEKLKALPQQPAMNALGSPLTMGVASQFNSGSNNAFAGSFSLQYSLPYLQSQVHDYGLPSFVNNLIPIVEFDWTSPSGAPSTQGTTWTVAPGVIYLAQWGEVGVEALIPANRSTGTTVGAVGLVHFFFDDLFPNTIGKPLIP
jgi:hypothetical protein